jgi:hypothetical protein
MRCACTNNGEAQIVCLYRRVSYYKVIVSGHIFDYYTLETCKVRHALTVHVIDLIIDRAPMTLIQDVPGCVSPITKKSKTCLTLARRRFNYRLGSL